MSNQDLNTLSDHPIVQRLTNHAKRAFFEAVSLSRKIKSPETESFHLLYAIYLEKGSVGSNILKETGITKEHFLDFFKKKSDERARNLSANLPPENKKIGAIFTQAYNVAKKFNYPYVGTEHLVYAIINSPDKNIAEIVSKADLSRINLSIKALFNPDQPSNIPKIFDIPEIVIGRTSDKKDSATPFIDKFCIDINKESAEKNEVIIGREREIQRLINILGRKNKNNPVLVGEAGVGKTALVSGLASRINSGAVPPTLYRKKIMSLDISQLIAGTSFRGEFESRLKEIIKEATLNQNIILFIDELHTIVGAGNVAGGLDLANILKPALARGEIQIIGATTFSEYKKHIEKDTALERRFQPIHLGEPSREETEKILFGIRQNYESFHNVIISDEAVRSAVDLSIRYIKNRFLPDKAIDVIDEAASHIRSRDRVSKDLHEISKLEDTKAGLLAEKERLVEQEEYSQALELRNAEENIDSRLKLLREKKSITENSADEIHITAADIIKTVSKISKVPEEKLSQEKTQKIKNIKKTLNAEIIGQKEVIEKLTSALFRSQSGIGNPDRPLGSFLFLGPTGVGKTLTAKVLAKEFFGSFDNKSDSSLIRIDMSELMERHSISSLIGSPAGYVGYGEGGRLTEKVRRNPYSAILFDEIEKAHPDVFNILLQILEDGILTDAEGTQVNFKNTIIILTSNIGTSDFTNASKVGFTTGGKNQKFDEIKQHTVSELEKRMRPELLNRLDYILVFNPLQEKDIRKIVRQELKKLTDRIYQQNIKLTYENDVIDLITAKSQSPSQGARMVHKNIQEMLESPIAEMIVYDKVKNGKIDISAKKDKISIV